MSKPNNDGFFADIGIEDNEENEEVTKTEEKEEVEKDKKSETSKPKETCYGGAEFSNFILIDIANGRLPTTITDKIKSGEKTLQGCFNWVASVMKKRLAEMNKLHGQTNGGIGGDMNALVIEYFDKVAEGTIVEQPKPAPKEKSTNKNSTTKAKLVKEVAKKASNDAKQANPFSQLDFGF